MLNNLTSISNSYILQVPAHCMQPNPTIPQHSRGWPEFSKPLTVLVVLMAPLHVRTPRPVPQNVRRVYVGLRLGRCRDGPHSCAYRFMTNSTSCDKGSTASDARAPPQELVVGMGTAGLRYLKAEELGPGVQARLIHSRLK